MELTFDDSELAALCCSRSALIERWGEEGQAAVARRLLELQAVEDLDDIDSLPHATLRLLDDGTMTVDYADGEMVVQGTLSQSGTEICLCISAVTLTTALPTP